MATFLVTQATGTQSRSVIQHLLEAGASVHAVVRDPSKIPAILERPGVTVFKGESQDSASVYQAAKGCTAAFLNTFPIPGLETQQAQGIVDASKKAGIKSIVASTTITTEDKAKWDNAESAQIGMRDYFQSKSTVEDVVRDSGLTYTILRPGYIHSDFYFPGCYQNFPNLPKGEIDHVYNDGTRMLYTDASDIGKYAAAALQDPSKFANQEIDLTNEYLTIEEVRDILVRITGRNVRVQKYNLQELQSADKMVFGHAIQMWANFHDFSAKEAAAKEVQAKFGIPFNTLEQALEREKAALLETIPA
jgi:uncharacterized protein YbjT (DUF2867 family)